MTEDHGLERFVTAQEAVFERALAELRDGRKRSHWMWFVFPQLIGLGRSATANFFAIRSLEEARQYLAHPVLGVRLRDCTETLLALPGLSIGEILDFPDDLKFRSSMTLFAALSETGSPFERALERFYGGVPDHQTLQLLRAL